MTTIKTDVSSKVKMRCKCIKVPLSLMHAIRDQLHTMNQSPHHAASWVHPRTNQTTHMIEAIDTVLERGEP